MSVEALSCNIQQVPCNTQLLLFDEYAQELSATLGSSISSEVVELLSLFESRDKANLKLWFQTLMSKFHWNFENELSHDSLFFLTLQGGRRLFMLPCVLEFLKKEYCLCGRYETKTDDASLPAKLNQIYAIVSEHITCKDVQWVVLPWRFIDEISFDEQENVKLFLDHFYAYQGIKVEQSLQKAYRPFTSLNFKSEFVGPDFWQNIHHLNNLDVLYFINSTYASFQKPWVSFDAKKLEHLLILSLSDYNAEFISDDLANLKSLENLNLSWNPCIAKQHLALPLTTRSLNLSECELTSIPPAVFACKNLSRLYLSENTIGSLPAELWSLTSLRELDCSDNNLKVLPDEMCDLIRLESFDCSWNKLTELPDDLGMLESLNSLNLENNDISVLPESLTDCNNLTCLWLSGNPFSQQYIEHLQKLLPHTTITFKSSYMSRCRDHREIDDGLPF